MSRDKGDWQEYLTIHNVLQPDQTHRMTKLSAVSEVIRGLRCCPLEFYASKIEMREFLCA